MMQNALQTISGLPSGERRVERRCGQGIVATLSYYAPSTEQRPHRHDYLQLSLLLTGSMCERLGGRIYELDRPAIGVKPPDSLHDDHWGRHGVLIFSLKLDSGGPLGGLADPSWRAAEDGATIGTLVRACLLQPHESSRMEAARDLLSLSTDAPLQPDHAAPAPWLARICEELRDDPDGRSVDDLARAAGVDRAHLARSFRRAYGMPPSVYRQRRQTARALAPIIDRKTPLSHIASDAGFCDQAHLTRHVSAQTGLPPGRLRDLLARG